MTRALLIAWCLKAAASSVLVPKLVAKDRDVQTTCAQLAGLADLYPHPDETDQSSVAIDLAVGAVEGGLDPQAIGDCRIPFPTKDDKWHACTWDREPRAFSAWQIYLPGATKTAEGYTGRDLIADIVKSTTVAHRMIAQSFVMGASQPRWARLAFYARGDAKSFEGQSLSRYRMWIADRLLAEVQP